MQYHLCQAACNSNFICRFFINHSSLSGIWDCLSWSAVVDSSFWRLRLGFSHCLWPLGRLVFLNAWNTASCLHHHWCTLQLSLQHLSDSLWSLLFVVWSLTMRLMGGLPDLQKDLPRHSSALVFRWWIEWWRSLSPFLAASVVRCSRLLHRWRWESIYRRWWTRTSIFSLYNDYHRLGKVFKFFFWIWMNLRRCCSGINVHFDVLCNCV